MISWGLTEHCVGLQQIESRCRRLRGWAEGLDSRWHAPRNGYPAGYADWRQAQGLAPWRKAWWPHSRLESYRTLRRYALLFDWAMHQDMPRNQAAWSAEQGRVVILRMGHLGDLLHLMPTVRALREQRPAWRLELITGAWNRALAERYASYFDRIEYASPDVVQFHRGDRRSVLSPAEERAQIARWRGEGVDIVFCPASPHYAELPMIVGLQPSVYVGTEWKLAGIPVPFPCRTRPFDSRHYELDAVGDFLPLMGLDRPELRLFYPVSQSARERVDAHLHQSNKQRKTKNEKPKTKNPKPQKPPMALLCPGSGWPGKNWPSEQFAALGDWLAKDRQCIVGFVGAPAELALCERVRARMTQAATIWAGQLSLDESAALIERAALVIGNDSAPIHLAAALGIPTVSLWGPTSPDKWAPKGSAHVAISSDVACAGCLYWHPNARCAGQPSCMTGINVSSVIQTIEKAGLIEHSVETA